MTLICCRLCLRNGPNLQPTKDLTITSNGHADPLSSNLSQFMVRYLSIESHSYGPIPVYICSECCNMIVKWHWFRETCLQNDTVYQNMVQELEKRDEHPAAAEHAEDCINVEIKQEEIEIGEVQFSEPLFPEQLEGTSPAEVKPKKPKTEHSLPRKVEDEGGREPPVEKPSKNPPKKRGRPKMSESERIQSQLPKMCPLCGKMVKALTCHLALHKQDRRYQCQHCPQKFYTLSVYKRHENVHTKKIKYTCQLCNKFFWRQDSLKMHMHMHSEGRAYKCPHCPKEYQMRASLVTHRKTHNGPPEVQCFGCEKKFYTTSLMKQHAIMHQDVKPYTCTICPRGFTRKYYLTWHMEKDHPGAGEPEDAGEGAS